MGVSQRTVRQSRKLPTTEGVFNGIIADEMSEAAEDSWREARRYVSYAGTQRVWNGDFPDLHQGTQGRRSGPGRGRVHTGAMRAALTYKVTQGKAVTGSVGWINRYEDYFGYQNEGFNAGGYRAHVQPPDEVSPVRGMQLMAHMRGYMRDQADLALDRAVRRIADGI